MLLPLFVRRTRPKSHLTDKNRLFDPRQKAGGSLKRRDFENYSLCSLLADRCRPFYRRHVLYACPAYRVLTLLIKRMLPVKRMFFC